MNDHTVKSYAEDLDRLSEDLRRMGGIAESMAADACTALVRGDFELCDEVAGRDVEVDRLHESVERTILRLLALRQPLAQDLRLAFAALKMAADLERIGDLSKNTARRGRAMERTLDVSALRGVERMGVAVTRQMHDVLDAFAARDAKLAYRVWENDEDVDQHYNSLFREALTYMMEDPRTIGAATHLLFITKNLERIGDHCTNVAETVYFLVTGERLSTEDRPKVREIDA